MLGYNIFVLTTHKCYPKQSDPTFRLSPQDGPVCPLGEENTYCPSLWWVVYTMLQLNTFGVQKCLMLGLVCACGICSDSKDSRTVSTDMFLNSEF